MNNAMMNDKKKKPPRIAQRLLHYMISPGIRDRALGDFEEIYFSMLNIQGKVPARIWYWKQVMKSLPAFVRDTIRGNYDMFKNYLKIALRHINRQKLYSFIIISGLAVGLALFILTVLYVDFTFQYDRFHNDADRIYSLVSSRSIANGNAYHTMKSPAPVLPLLKAEFPEIEDATRFFHESERVFQHEDNIFYEGKVWYADPNFLAFFSFNMVSGDNASVLAEPNSVVITESTALKYFGSLNPIGKILTFNRAKNTELIVKGVVEDIPMNSSIQFDFLISSNTFDWFDDWDVECAAFFKLPQGATPSEFEGKLPAFIRSRLPRLQKQGEMLSLFPLVDIHLHSTHILSHFMPSSPIQAYFILGTGVILLLIVSINFMNLSTARYMKRAREVGLRKVVGASRLRLIQQFLGESVLLSLFALPVAFLLFEMVRPVFMAYVGIDTGISFWQNPALILLVLGVTLGVGIFSGIYPAFFLSAFKPISVLEQTFSGVKGNRTRRALVIIQFTLSIVLIIFTLVIQKQVHFLLQTDLGYHRKDVAVLKVHPEMVDRLETLKFELQRHPKITAVGGANGYPFNWGHEENIQTKEMSAEDAYPIKTYHIDYGFIESLEIEIMQGRSFSRDFNDSHSYVLSELAVSQLGWEDPIGRSLNVGGQWGTVVGVVNDVHFTHVFFEWGPSVLYLKPDWTHILFLKLSPPYDEDLRQFVKAQWRTVAPDLPIEFSMLEDDLQLSFSGFKKASEAFRIISIISLFISCLGLIGLASFTAERKTQEIGVRKVLGATVPSLVRMLITEFSLFVAISNLIAVPIALWGTSWFLKSAWVEQTKIDPWIFITAIMLSFAAALFSVIIQSLRAANANPVESLRYK